MTESEDLYQIAVLIDQLKHEDLQLRISAFKSIELIASALGAERTRDELIPFLAESIEDEDEVLLVLAENLSKLSGYVGGAEHLHVLLAPLQLLLEGEEGEVRDRALQTVEALVRQMGRLQVSQRLLPLLETLSGRDWHTARAAAVLLCPCAYASLDEDSRQSAVLPLLLRSSSDTTPSVRRAVAKVLPRLAAASSPALLRQLFQLFGALCKDEQDSAKIQCIQAAVHLAAHCGAQHAEFTQQLVQSAAALAADPSWRVRWSLGHHLHDILQNMVPATAAPGSSSSGSGGVVAGTFGSVYQTLLSDAEPEVRAAAVAHFSAMASLLPHDLVLGSLLGSVQRLAQDGTDFVRAAAASELAKACSALSSEEAAALVLPSLVALLRDEKSEVRLNIVACLSEVHQAVGIDALSSSLLPALADLGQDSKWRVRLAVVEHMPNIARQLGQQLYTGSALLTLSLAWLSDRVYYVRQAAASSLCKLTALFGLDWAGQHVVPTLLKMQETSSAPLRLTLLNVASALLLENAMNSATAGAAATATSGALLSLVLALAQDKVANVRLTAAKVLGVLLAKTSGGGKILPVLQLLARDQDRDVRFYASRAVVV
eukprot:gene26448-31965_t